MRKLYAGLLCVLLAMALCACSGEPAEEAPPVEAAVPQTETVSVRVSGAQSTLDPASVTAQGGETILFHLYENLLRWEDDGTGWAVLANGQAEDYTVEADFAGNATYTFTLREGIRWSDGTPVTARDFVYAWRRLADPANGLPHRTLLSEISGYAEVQETGDASLLGVSAPDSRTLVVNLTGSPAYFLEEICAGAYTMPLREDLPSHATARITNGPYTAATGFSARLVTLNRSETYYDSTVKGPETIRFVTKEGSAADYAALQSGEAVLATDLPEDALQELSGGGTWTPEPVTSMYGVLLNCRQAPFDNENVRKAFHLAINRQAIADALLDLTLRPAPGVVPYGVSDYHSQRPVVEAPVETETIPDPNAQQTAEAVPDPTCWDFRSHAETVVTAEHTHDYESDCNYAKALMAQAGYPNGANFPAVEYLYHVDSEFEAAAAGCLQRMWRDCLGVAVTLRGVSDEEYREALTPVLPEEDGEGETSPDSGEAPVPIAPFQMAAQDFAPAYSDAEALLESWYGGGGANASGYASDDFDILLTAARAAVSADARDAYLHDAEAILLEDSPVIPLLCRGGSFRLADGLTGLYRAPDGVYFLYRLQAGESAN